MAVRDSFLLALGGNDECENGFLKKEQRLPQAMACLNVAEPVNSFYTVLRRVLASLETVASVST